MRVQPPASQRGVGGAQARPSTTPTLAHARTHARTHARVPAHMYKHMHTHILARARTHAHTHTRTHAHTCVHTLYRCGVLFLNDHLCTRGRCDKYGTFALRRPFIVAPAMNTYMWYQRVTSGGTGRCPSSCYCCCRRCPTSYQLPIPRWCRCPRNYQHNPIHPNTRVAVVAAAAAVLLCFVIKRPAVVHARAQVRVCVCVCVVVVVVGGWVDARAQPGAEVLSPMGWRNQGCPTTTFHV